MTTTVITRINRVTKTTASSSVATLAVWKTLRGMWKTKKIQPVQYQRSVRKESTS